MRRPGCEHVPPRRARPSRRPHAHVGGPAQRWQRRRCDVARRRRRRRGGVRRPLRDADVQRRRTAPAPSTAVRIHHSPRSLNAPGLGRVDTAAPADRPPSGPGRGREPVRRKQSRRTVAAVRAVTAAARLRLDGCATAPGKPGRPAPSARRSRRTPPAGRDRAAPSSVHGACRDSTENSAAVVLWTITQSA